MGMAEGTARVEAPIAVVGGRASRIDLLLTVDDNRRPLLVVVEIKNTDWDARAVHRLRPNLTRHARQVWRYLDPFMPELDLGELAGVQAALVYPRRPSLPGRAELVVGVLGEQGISVLFYEDLGRNRRSARRLTSRLAADRDFLPRSMEILGIANAHPATISLHLRSTRRLAARDGAERAGTPSDGRSRRHAVCAGHER
jgi:hypothetical protein